MQKIRRRNLLSLSALKNFILWVCSFWATQACGYQNVVVSGENAEWEKNNEAWEAGWQQMKNVEPDQQILCCSGTLLGDDDIVRFAILEWIALLCAMVWSRWFCMLVAYMWHGKAECHFYVADCGGSFILLFNTIFLPVHVLLTWLFLARLL